MQFINYIFVNFKMNLVHLLQVIEYKRFFKNETSHKKKLNLRSIWCFFHFLFN